MAVADRKITGPGCRMPSPILISELLDLPLSDSASLNKIPHNACANASLCDITRSHGLFIQKVEPLTLKSPNLANETAPFPR
jgi:hypothetical protein